MTHSNPLINTPAQQPRLSRRTFLRQAGSLALTAGAAAAAPAWGVFAADDPTIRLALIGCGGRGSGAVADALSVANQGPVKLYAMADLDERKMIGALASLRDKFPDQVEVTADRRFVGFGSHRQAIDCLRPGDVALCTTRSYIRPLHVEYAVSKGINVFMEKPFASDPGGLHRLLRVSEVAERRNVKVAAGLQCRHSPARQALIDRIREGTLGDITLIRANRLAGARWLDNQGAAANDLMSQLQFGKIHLLWVGSGHMADNLIHQIDECCWIKDAWPVAAHGMGGRSPDSTDLGQNLDVYSMEYTFADGTKAFCGFRRINRGQTEFATWIHGTKSAAQFSGQTHAATVHQFKDQRIGRPHIAWTPAPDTKSPWRYEWDVLIESIRKDRRHNEIKRSVYSDLTTLMGRAAAHYNRTVTWDEVMESRSQFCENLDTLNYDSTVPVKANERGQFPWPIAGKWTEL
ncbi:MAG: Gfo/Idh/MocA family oxidoreductase [Verrucomicrobia bacterium]|nr:Gfo/Idh/MocA family oxidoreductase [Verrucomicrobiota bacterium]